MNIETVPNGVYFSELFLENIKCFKSPVSLKFTDDKSKLKKWTIILGDNGLGKTTILQSIAGLEIVKLENEAYTMFLGRDIRDAMRLSVNAPHSYIKANLLYSQDNLMDMSSPERRLPEPREGDEYDMFIKLRASGGSSFNGKFYLGSNDKSKLLIFSYGANRTMGETSLAENFLEKNSETLFFENSNLINAEEWLLRLDYAASKDSTVKDFALTKRDQVKQTLIDLLPDVHDIRFTVPTKNNLKSTIEFNTSFGWVGMRDLSLGYKSMISWIVDLAARLFEFYSESKNPLAEPAIVLVDEIDLHLHPKWQRKLFEYLSEKFPNIQFIVTAHSPLIVQAAPKDANLVVLRKDGDHVEIDQDIESVKKWRIDQILTSDLFGLESARGPETEKWLLERTELLQKKELNEQEKERLNELNKLAHNLPTADNAEDIEAMEIIRKAADYLKEQKK